MSRHDGRFDDATGQAKGPPVRINLRTCRVKIEGNKVVMDLG